MLNKKDNQKGVIHIILVLAATLIVILSVVVIYIISDDNNKIPGSEFVREEAEKLNLVKDVDEMDEGLIDQISGSDEPAVIEEELDETDLGFEEMDKELDELDKELESL